MPARRLLILGGTTEAAALARAVDDRFGPEIDVITSLAGRLAPNQQLSGQQLSGQQLPGRTRIGGFGGIPGLVRYLQEERIDAVIDATHPFAATMSDHACAACSEVGIPRLALVRPPWQPSPEDCWHEASGLNEGAALLPDLGRRAFLTTGPGGIGAFATIRTVWFLVRVFTAPEVPFCLPQYTVIVQRPPFTVASELALLKAHRIDTLVTKQSGGPTEAKLLAARQAGIPVIMVRRPPPPPGEIVDSVPQALDWLCQK